MSKNLEDENVEKMLERYRRGLLTKEELDDFMQLQQHRSEARERALQAGRAPRHAAEGEEH